MKVFNAGVIYCDFCKKEIPVRVYHSDEKDGPRLEIEEIKSWAKNYHWYDFHYNCAVCGEYIPSDERELVIKKDFPVPVNKKYNEENPVRGLLRVHKECIDNLE
jgi:hypothetical protein